MTVATVRLSIPGYALDRSALRYQAIVTKTPIPLLADRSLRDHVSVIDAAIAGVRNGYPDASSAYAAAVDLPAMTGDGCTIYEVDVDAATVAALRCHSGGAAPVEQVAAGIVHRAAERVNGAYVAWADEMMTAMLDTGISA